MLDESRFDDIRPYNDDEVVAVLDKLINEKELQAIIASYMIPKAYKVFPWFFRQLIKLSSSSYLLSVFLFGSLYMIFKTFFKVSRRKERGENAF